MGVAVIEGSKAERIATGVEEIARILGDPSGLENLQDLIIADRNALTDVEWSTGTIAGNTGTYRYSSIFDLTPNVQHAIWAPKSTIDGLKITILLYDDANSLRLNTTFDFNDNNAIQQIPPRQYYARAQIGISPSNVPASYYKMVFFGPVTSGGALTDAELRYYRRKIDAVSSAEVSEVVTGVIKYSEDQTVVLTSDEKKQARNNIGAISSNEVSDLVTGVVKYSEDQSKKLTVIEKQQARDNIGAISSNEVSELVTGVVKYSEDQTEKLSDDEKAQARNNINAASSSDVTGVVKYSEDQTDILTDDEKKQARNNIGTISSSEVNDLVTGVIKYSVDQSEELTSNEKQRARKNIGAISADDIVQEVGAVKYTEEQGLGVDDQAMARKNIGAAAASVIGDIQLDIEEMKSNVSDVTKDGDTITVTYANDTVSTFKIEANTGTQIANVVYDSEYQLHFLDEDGQDLFTPITIQGGGGGTGGSGSAYISRIGSAAPACIQGESLVLKFELVAKDANGSEVPPGTMRWLVNGSVVASGLTVPAGTNRFDIGPYLSQAGENEVQVEVNIDVGNERNATPKLRWTVNAVNLSFTWNYDVTQVNRTGFKDSWVVYGNKQKSMHTLLDDTTELDTLISTKSNQTQSIDIPMQTHGIHSIEHWLTADIDGTVKSTPHQYKEVIFDDGVTGTPVIGLSKKEFEVAQYTTIQIGAIIYDPQTLTASAQLYVDGEKRGDWKDVDRTMQYWTYTPTQPSTNVTEWETQIDDSGKTVQIAKQWTHQIMIVTGSIPKWEAGLHYFPNDKIIGPDGKVYLCNTDNIDTTFTASKWREVTGDQALGMTMRYITVTVNAIDLDVSEVAGYSFRFKSSDFASNSAVQDWTSNGVTATFSSNFDWVNGGLQSEMVDAYMNEVTSGGALQQYLSIKSGTSMTINHQLFATDPKAAGFTYKIIFKIKNCRNYNAEIMSCHNGTSGIRMYAHSAVLNSSGASIDIPYNEDSYMELEMDIYPARNGNEISATPYMVGWLDGVMTTCRTYGNTDVFTHNGVNAPGIVIGSDDCDIQLYMVKVYPFLVDTDNNIANHMANFIMDAPNTEEMLRRYQRNDILDDGGEISYVKLRNANPNLRVWLYDIPYMTVAKDDKVSIYKFEQFWPAGGEKYHLTGKGKMSVQGTSSVNYIRGAANTDINFSELTDGEGNDLLLNGVQDKPFGGSNNWYYKDESTGKTKIFTAVEARAETGGDLGPEWVVVERASDAARTPTKYIKALGMKINDDSCPISYSNTKVNFASCEQVNNMCNAIWYQRFNPYPSLTARDCMEFGMGVQFIKDHEEYENDGKHFSVFDNDDNYHLYSIANMGNSKKNVHVFHDLSNSDKEVCIEVKDSTAAQHRMISDDLTTHTWDGDGYFEMRYPDTKTPSDDIKQAWQDLLTWFATNNPQAATGEKLTKSEHYDEYQFQGHSRSGTQVLRGTRVTQYAGDYEYDTFERRMAKMLKECEEHLVMDSIIYHFVYLERHTMIDNVAKNNFWSTTDLQHWDMSKAYDMDTSDGNDNQGKLSLDYGLEYSDNYTDAKGAERTVFNGSDSVWFVFAANLYEACRTMFQHCEAEGAWSANAYHKFFLDTQRAVPERCWNQCYWRNYLRPYEQNINTAWLPFLDGGQKTHQRAHYEQFQEIYMSAKYHGSVSTVPKITLNAYTPGTWGGIITDSNGATLRADYSIAANELAVIPNGGKISISGKQTDSSRREWRKVIYNGIEGWVLYNQIDSIEPKAELTIAMYPPRMYLSIDNGTFITKPVRVLDNKPHTVEFGGGGEFSNAMIYVNAAPMIRSLEGIEQLYITEGILTYATRLREIHVGSNEKNYYNSNMQGLGFSNSPMLEKLYIQNMTGASEGLNLKGCPALVYVDATGSTFTSYEFATGGLVETAILQAPTTLTMKDLSKLKDWSDETETGLKILDYSRLIGITYEDVPGVDSLGLITRSSKLGFARFVNIEWIMDSADILSRLYTMSGYSEIGTTTSRAVLSGTANVDIISSRDYAKYTEAWSPNLEITYNQPLIQQYAVTFVNPDGTTVKDRAGKDYIQYVDYNGYAYDPVAAGEIDAPTMASDQQYIYTYSGWSGLDGRVIAEGKVVTTTYTTETRKYRVRWFIKENSTIPDRVKTAEFGSEALYDDEDPYFIPKNTDMEDYGFYRIFAGWDNSTGYITEDTDVHAIWETSSIPAKGEKELSEMTPAEIYAISKIDDADSYWEPKDWFDMQVGFDFDFENVESHEIITEPTYFDGTNMLATEYKLFSENADSFTLAVDFEMVDASNNATLISCHDPANMNGFKIGMPASASTTSRVRLLWGNTYNDTCFNGKRCMLVLRHKKGSSKLWIGYYGDTTSSFIYDLGINEQEINRTTFSDFEGVLTFGGVLNANNRWVNSGNGWIYWCKLWYGDLGPTCGRQLAAWPHETWRFDYISANRYYLAGNSVGCSASFMAEQLLTGLYNMNDTAENAGGWRDSSMRSFCNTKVITAVPYRWRSIFAKVSIPSLSGNKNNDLIFSDEGDTSQNQGDLFYLPAFTELANATGAYANEGSRIEWTAQYKNISFYPGMRPRENYVLYTGSTDPATQPTVYPEFKEGDMWDTNSSYYYSPKIYVSEETISKHKYVGQCPTSITSTSYSNQHRKSNAGGIWMGTSDYYLRTPRYDITTGFYYIDAWHRSKSASSQNATNNSGVLLCFST